MLFALRTLDGSRHAASTVISGSKPMTFMPSLIAVSATRLPIAPRPTMPSVRCGSSTPANCFLPSSTRASRSARAGIEAADVAQRRHHVARRQQQRGEHQLLDRVGVGAGRIEHRHAARRHLGDRNVVGARAGAADRLDARRNRHRVHVVRAHEDRVRVVDRLADGVARRREAVQPVAEIWLSVRIW